MNVQSRTEMPFTTIDYFAKKRRTITLMVVYSIVIGIMSCFLIEEDPILNRVLEIPYGILAVVWCVYDAGQHGYRFGKAEILLLFFLFIIVFPYYLFRSRGIHAWKTLLLSVGLVADLLICTRIAQMATLIVGMNAGHWDSY